MIGPLWNPDLNAIGRFRLKRKKLPDDLWPRNWQNELPTALPVIALLLDNLVGKIPSEEQRVIGLGFQGSRRLRETVNQSWS
jgi:hypothetical protein